MQEENEEEVDQDDQDQQDSQEEGLIQVEEGEDGD